MNFDADNEQNEGFEPAQVDKRRVVVLISGNGSNLQALLDAQEHDELGGEVVAVISNRGDAYGLVRAKEAGIPAVVLPHSEYESRDAFDGALIKVIERHEPNLVVLAGFMRILSPVFVNRFHGRLLNIHPSLLPAYRGLDTHARVIADKSLEHGASVHFVSDELDGGPVIVQAAVNVEAEDTAESLAEKVLRREHLIYPMVVKWFLEGRLQLAADGPRLDGHKLPEGGLRLGADDVDEEDL
ncbi:phosphoribosylglycinamide formyltransferase [Phytohalomonas tamaricis]|uniref:phosphoribosylglycinamide formyltransferase n=1 Tax=Phytohalomonas tamaricis TaxID=2081032 RepID=UPI000D0BCF07|nr:phosphoribosylglycinamide formyltransferase [Phytohalomonas tamaricis]